MSFALRLQSMSWTWGGSRWLIAPYGVSNWVRNVRAFKEVALTRRQHTDKYRAEEVTDTKSGAGPTPYLKGVRVVRPYFDATPDSSDDELFAESSGSIRCFLAYTYGLTRVVDYVLAVRPASGDDHVFLR